MTYRNTDVPAAAALPDGTTPALTTDVDETDPYSGACQVDQFLLWRPFPQLRGHRTPVDGLWYIGASTHPGPGLSGASGLLAAQDVMRPSPLRRLARLLPGR